MRFCPFCSAENADDLAVCQACGRRLPPLPPRRTRNAPPTGIQLPPRAANPTQPPATARQLGLESQPPPTPANLGFDSGPTTVNPPSPPIAARVTSPGHPVQPGPAPAAVASVGSGATERRSILSAISPGPAAHRREAPLEPPRTGDPTRRMTDLTMPDATVPRRKTASIPPAIPPARSKGTTLPPPIIDRPPAEPAPGVPVPMSPTALSGAFSGPAAAPPAPDPEPLSALVPGVPLPAAPRVPKAPTLPSTTGPLHIASSAHRTSPSGIGIEPPPTRIQRADSLVERPFTPPQVSSVPEVPEPGLVNAAKYAVRFGRARWQRRGAIKILSAEINQDTAALDGVLGALGRQARESKLEGRAFAAENAAITAAEERVMALSKEQDEVDARRTDENTRFVEIERERNAKLGEAESLVDEAQKDLAHLEGQRRGYRDKRKELERRQKAYLKAAEDSEKSAGASQMGETRAELRRAAEMHRKEAALLEPERQDIDRRIAALERPIGEATAKLDAAKAEFDAAKRSLADAREGHTHRLAELDAEQKRKARDIGNADTEIAQRLVTLGTLVNLNRVEDPAFGELYGRIDRLRGAITSRTTEIEKLTSEREAFDRGTLTRGVATIGGAIVLLIALVVIIAALA